MKCLCFSDSHGSSYYISRALALHPDAEVVFFLGDGISDFEEAVISDRKPRAYFAVRGNCDNLATFMNRPLKKTETLTLLGRKIIITHGDMYMVKYSDEGLKKLAASESADVVIFGHTHRPTEKYVNLDLQNVYFFNPGSIGIGYGNVPTYGVISMDEDNILFSHGSFA